MNTPLRGPKTYRPVDENRTMCDVWLHFSSEVVLQIKPFARSHMQSTFESQPLRGWQSRTIGDF